MQALPAVGGHIHIEARHQRVRAISWGGALYLPVPVPISHNHTIEAPMGF